MCRILWYVKVRSLSDMIIRNPSGATRVPSMTSRLFHNIAWWERHCLPFVSISLSQKCRSWHFIFSCRRCFPIFTLGQYMPLLVQHKFPFHLNRLSQWQRTGRSAHDWLLSERLYFDVEPEASIKKVSTFALLLVDYDSIRFVSFASMLHFNISQSYTTLSAANLYTATLLLVLAITCNN